MHKTRAALVFLGLLAGTSNGFALDLCFYLDANDTVLKIDDGTAQLTLTDHSTISCTLTRRPGSSAVRSGTCQDQPGVKFDSFSAKSNPTLPENDLLIFWDAVWYLKCAFKR